MTVREALKTAGESLAAAGIAEPFREANSLLQFAIARDRAFTIAHPEYELSAKEADLFQAAIACRAAREPLQHIVGRQEFYGLDFLVTPDVLIPRPETELIVERAIELIADLPSPRFLEIGVGSGCISVAILKYSPKAVALAVDISEPAIVIANRNADLHRVSDRLTILSSDVFENVPEEDFDLIVSNPPYVPLDEYVGLQPEVRDHDPRMAVTDGSTGLTIIERIIGGAPDYLNSGGHLLMEIGHGQSDQVTDLIDPGRWQSPEFIPDLQGIRRTLDLTKI
ncbi:MAG TPA: peptide chain release factor N(5)-glutamine methyltransferase [Pyrinomonadaceae bacterium]|nr:peptide chain release factor N(5)-glutamine methyltransferase [Pyrinomonadaceae bacterium]